MEDDGIITRTVYPEVPPRVEYALSDLGETMGPILNAMQEWGDITFSFQLKNHRNCSSFIYITFYF